MESHTADTFVPKYKEGVKRVLTNLMLLLDFVTYQESKNNPFLAYLDCRDSKMERYQKMWRFMESHTADTFVPSYEEGVKRVLNGSYAFLGESAMLDYLVQRNCNLTQIGGLLDSKGKVEKISLSLKIAHFFIRFAFCQNIFIKPFNCHIFYYLKYI